MDFFYGLAAAFAVFVLWLCSKILEKAGIDKIWVLVLLIPIVNIVMLWIFAFIDWPGLKNKHLLDSNTD